MKKWIRELLFLIRGECSTKRLITRGMQVGKNFNRSNGVILDPSHCWLISIGDNVTLAPRVHVLAHDASTKNILNYTKVSNVKIGNNVFVGAGSIILPGVNVGDNVIIGAGSVVTKNVPEGTLYAGNPARFICTLKNYIEKQSEAMKSSPIYSEAYTLRGNVSENQKKKMINELNENVGYIE